jgi:hypothetical protein
MCGIRKPFLSAALLCVLAFASWAEPTNAEALAQGEEANAKVFAACEDLRASLHGVEKEDQERLELSVLGVLTMVEFDGALAYLAVCAAPAPQVLCIAYGTNGFEVGDPVILSGGLGGYARPDPDHILLDPCLPSPPAS